MFVGAAADDSTLRGRFVVAVVVVAGAGLGFGEWLLCRTVVVAAVVAAVGTSVAGARVVVSPAQAWQDTFADDFGLAWEFGFARDQLLS